ncbi:cation diffusion facilitator family transporter [Ramlibacter sp. G-1-2-2]|uniref:Cation diffusion facilitator family transporter n=1 Tax=Ramlibacter agri TaxID=2728837 RepID=A0A848H899_9BURK|nr:cation diffusion facilitator family transporter [Ramlibacter agri]NML44763.1 cation diffusion facilitator family transporter [Ramlibacter agri]
MSTPSTRFVVFAALAGNLLVALTKTAAAVWSGSSSMASESVHSFVDTGNELLLLYGMRRSRKPPDRVHPIGYGRELYFWSFVVALLVFAAGAGVSLVQGVMHLRAPQEIENAHVNYVVLGLSFLFEGGSFIVSLRQFRAAQGTRGWFAAFRASKDPPSFMVLFEDSAALLGIALAALGTWGSDSFGLLWVDGVASILIGVVLAGVALLLGRESKSLLIGERIEHGLSEAILAQANGQEGVHRAHGLFSVHLAPDQVVVALSLEFRDELTAPQIEAAVRGLEKRVREAHPEVVSLLVKPQTEAGWREENAKRAAGPPGTDSP